MKKGIFSLVTLILFVQLLLSGCHKDDLNYATITKVVIKSFPPTKSNGTPWDPNSVADLFIKLTRSNGDVFYEPAYKPSSSPYSEHTFNIAGPEIQLFPDTYGLSLYDSDSADQQTFEFIGKLNFVIQENEEVSPIVLSGNGISAEIYLEYIH